MRNNKGFTIIEIIVVIALMSLIWLVFANAFTGSIRSLEDQIEEETGTNITDTLFAYFRVAKNNRSLRYFYEPNGNVISCIRIRTLIEEGFFEENVLRENNWNANDVFRIRIDCQGVLHHSRLTTTNLVNSQCSFNEMNMSGFFDHSVIDAPLGNDRFDLNVTVSPTGVNTFSVDTNFFTMTTLTGNGSAVFRNGTITFTLTPQFNTFFEVVEGSFNPNRIVVETNLNRITVRINPSLFNQTNRTLRQQLGFDIRFRPATTGSASNIQLFNQINIRIENNLNQVRQSTAITGLPSIPFNRRNSSAIN